MKRHPFRADPSRLTPDRKHPPPRGGGDRGFVSCTLPLTALYYIYFENEKLQWKLSFGPLGHLYSGETSIQGHSGDANFGPEKLIAPI